MAADDARGGPRTAPATQPGARAISPVSNDRSTRSAARLFSRGSTTVLEAGPKGGRAATSLPVSEESRAARASLTRGDPRAGAQSDEEAQHGFAAGLLALTPMPDAGVYAKCCALTEEQCVLQGVRVRI